MLRDTPVLRDKVNDKSRNSGNTILQKIFPGGHVTMVGANSPSSLASRPIRILLADEIDRYPATAGNEGDPLLLAGKRLATFWNKKEVCVSTPTNKETSRIAVEFEHSTQEEWNVPCPACGAFTPLLWANIVFDRDKLDEISCTCPACGVVSSETEWKEQYINGKFVAAHPERKVRGFHLNALASLFVDWREIVEKFLTANEEKKKGNIELLKVWTNTEMGETWEEDGEQIETDDLYKRREKYSPERQITAFIGPSGCGKSTFLRTLNRMNDLITSVKIQGQVDFHGKNIYDAGVDPTLLRKRIGMVFQKANPFPMSIYDNVAYGPRTHGIRSHAKLDDIVERSLRSAAIWDEVKDRLKKSAMGLSGGQQQRLCIARALAVEPEVLLMDEATSALDPISTSKIEDLALELKEHYTVVMVTHNMQQAARISDNTAFFLLGELVEFGRTEQLFSAPADKRTEDYITGRFG